MNDKIFVPLTLDNSTKTAFSGKQLFGFCLFGLLYFTFQIAVLRLRDGLLFNVRMAGLILFCIEVVGTYFIVFLLRKIVIREDRILQNYQNNQALQKTELDFAWDIFSIKNSHIRYCSSGREAVVIRLTHGYLLDRPMDQEQIHRQAINTALGNLSKQGFSHIYLNREVRDANLVPLQETQRNMVRYRGTKLYDVGNQMIKHTFSVCANIANMEQEYYIILADNMDTIKRLDHAAQSFINALQGGVYVKTEILADDEIWELICRLYGLKFIDKSRLLNKMFSNNNLQLIEILEVNRASQNIPVNQSRPASYTNTTDTQVPTVIATDKTVKQQVPSEEDYL